MQIMDMVLRRLDKTESEPELELALWRVGAFIREYCALEEIPPSLFPLWADMTVDCYAIRRGDATPLQDNDITAVTMGDVSYTFGQTKAPDDSRSFMKDYKHRLQKARRGLLR